MFYRRTYNPPKWFKDGIKYTLSYYDQIARKIGYSREWVIEQKLEDIEKIFEERGMDRNELLATYSVIYHYNKYLLSLWGLKNIKKVRNKPIWYDFKKNKIIVQWISTEKVINKIKSFFEGIFR